MVKSYKMDQEVYDILQEQLKLFKEKFGREPGPEDPIFFDPDYDDPVPISEEKLKEILIETAKKAGIDYRRVLLHVGFDEEEIPKEH